MLILSLYVILPTHQHQAKGKVIHPSQQHPQPLNTPNIPLFILKIQNQLENSKLFSIIFKLFFLCFREFQDDLKKTLQNILDFSE